MFTVVMPVFQTPNILSLCLDSLTRTITMPTHIILIDDGSPQESKLILERFAASEHLLCQVTLLCHSESIGCPKSINEGLRASPADGYIVFTDSDVIFSSGWQEEVHSTFQQDAQIGGIGGVLLYPQTGGIQSCGIGYHNYLGRHIFLNNNPDCLMKMGCFRVQATVFAFFAARADLVRRTGVIDEGFFNGYEDIDFQLRLRQLGYEIVINPQIRLYHWEKSNGAHRVFSRRQNLGRFWSKNCALIRDDMLDFLLPQIKRYAQYEKPYIGIDLSEARIDASAIWAALKEKVSIQRMLDVSAQCSGNKKLWLPELLSSDFFCVHSPLLFLCDNFTQLTENQYWFGQRRQYCREDLIVDIYANVLPVSQLEFCCWPGSKIR